MFTESSLFKKLRKELIAFVPKKKLVELIAKQEDNITTKLNSYSYLYDKLADNFSKENLVRLTIQVLYPNFPLIGLVSRRKILDMLESNNKRVKIDDFSTNFNDNSNPSFFTGLFGKHAFALNDQEVELYSESISKFMYENSDMLHYSSNGKDIQVEQGDYVICGGSCFGEGDFRVLHQVGSTGKVFGVEVEEKTRSVLNKNIELVSKVIDTSNYRVIDKALWDKDKEILEFTTYDDNPQLSSLVQAEHLKNTKIDNNFKSHVTKVETITIDSLLQQENANKLDYIKLDVEGAELNVLQGAKNSLINYKPKLAISIYHLPDDYETIPKYLESLNVGYKFYLQTFYNSGLDTILFATVC